MHSSEVLLVRVRMRRVFVKEHLRCSTQCMMNLREADYEMQTEHINNFSNIFTDCSGPEFHHLALATLQIMANECNKNGCFQVFILSEECIC